MTRNVFFAILLIVFAAGSVSAQSCDLFYQLNEKQPDYGTITISQDAMLFQLVDAYVDANKRDGMKGYRIQIYSGSGQNARATQLNVANAQKNLDDWNAKAALRKAQLDQEIKDAEADIKQAEADLKDRLLAIQDQLDRNVLLHSWMHFDA